MLRQDAVDNEKLILNTQLPQFTGSAIGFLQRCCFRSRYQEQRGLVAACKGIDCRLVDGFLFFQTG